MFNHKRNKHLLECGMIRHFQSIRISHFTWRSFQRELLFGCSGTFGASCEFTHFLRKQNEPKPHKKNDGKKEDENMN